MKVAEIFSQLTFKIEGADQLKELDSMLKTIAESARAAATAMKALAATRLPKGMLVPPKGGGGGGGGAGPGGRPVVVVPVTPTTPAPPAPPSPPIIPGATSPGGGGGANWGQLAKVALAFVGVGSLIGLLKSMVSGFKEMIASVRVFAQATKNLAQQTGLSLRQIKTWEALGAKVGMKPEDVQGILGQLTKNAVKLRNEGGDLTPYARAGVSTTADADTQLRQFMRNTANMTAKDASYIGAKLGISDELIAAMRQYGNELDKIAAGTENTVEAQEALVALNKAWNQMTFQAGVLADKITTILSPALIQVIDLLTNAERILGTSSGRSMAMQAIGPGPNLSFYSALIDAFKGSMQAGNTSLNTSVYIDGKRMPNSAVTTEQKQINKAYYGAPNPQFNN